MKADIKKAIGRDESMGNLKHGICKTYYRFNPTFQNSLGHWFDIRCDLKPDNNYAVFLDPRDRHRIRRLKGGICAKLNDAGGMTFASR